MPIDFPTSPSSGQRYDYLSKSWIWNGVYWASVGASGNITSGQLGTPVVFSGNIASGSISAFNLASGIGGSSLVLTSGSITSGFIGNNAVTSGNIASGQVGRVQINDFNVGTNLTNSLTDGKGYFAGGDSGSIVATADKLTYSTDTTIAQTTANLSQARVSLAGVSEGSTKGYFAGGYDQSINIVTTADKLTYAGDITVAQTSANLSQARARLAGCSGEGTKGYFAGGRNASGDRVTTADKLTYSNDTTVAQTTANLTQAREYLAGISDGSTKGYFAGGFTSASVTTADKLTFSNDTTAAQTSANLSQGRYGLGGCSGEGTKGYFAGGNPTTATADKITYSTDTTAAQASANLSQARRYLAGVSEGSTKGYFAGGDTGTGLFVATADKLTYSTDTTVAQTTANLSQARNELTGIDGRDAATTVFGNNCVFSGNIASGQIGQFHFSSGTIFNSISSGLIKSGNIGNNAVNSGNIGGGQVGRFQINDFNPGTSLVVTRFGLKGYFAGGANPTITATADKLTYSTDTTAAQTTANLSQARSSLAGVSEKLTKGYFAGGTTNASVATADKLTYSTDTTVVQASANLSQARDQLAGCSGDLTKGYFAGGNTGSRVTTADKVTYLTDTTAAQTTANLSQARQGLAGISDGSTKGYFAGGLNSSGNSVTTADKLTFSNDTTAAQTTANLSQARYGLAGCNGNSTGYFAGGTTNSINRLSTADKLTYSTDTTTAQTSANLSQARFELDSVSEGSTKGYFAGGGTGTGLVVATADKLTYSNDTTAAQTTANLSQAKYRSTGLSQEFALVFGNNSITSGSISSGQIGQFHFSSGTTLLSGVVQSGMIGDSAVTSGNISSGQISTSHLSDQSVSSGVIVSGVVSRFKLSNEAIYSGAIASGQIPIFSLSSGLLISSSFGNESVGSGQILASSVLNSGGKIGSQHIASGEINSFNIASGAVNASSRLGSQSVFNLETASIAVGASLIFPASIWTTNLAFDSILSGGISSGIIGNTKISDQGVGSGAIASGQIFRFHTSSGFINSGHFGDNALSSGSFNFGCVDGNSLTSGLWSVPYSQLVSGGIIAGYFNNNSINYNAFQYIQSYTNAGYFAGGQDNVTITARTNKLTYSTDTTVAQTSANLSQPRGDCLGGCSGEGTKGYFAGGSGPVATADKLTYLTDSTVAQTTANLSQARIALAGCSGEGTKGYFAGGETGARVATADKLTYSTDTTVAQTTANLSQARFYLAGVSEGSTKGYFAGGFSNAYTATADKLTYSTDTTAAQTTANLSQAKYGLAGISEGSTNGYFVGGLTGAAIIAATADKLTYSTDTTVAQTTANLNQARYYLAGISEGSTKGYFAGGNTGAGIADIVATTEKLTYSTDTIAAQTTANLNNPTYLLAGVDGGNAPLYAYNQIVTSGKLTTTAANEIRSTNFANNSILSGSINSNSIFSVIGGYTPFSIRSVRSGAIPTEEIGPSHFARGTLLSGNFSSGLLRLVDLLGDQIQSGNIGNRQINSGHFSSNFIVTSSMVASGSVDPSVDFAQTAELNTNFPLFDSFIFQEQCSGIKAVCISSGGRVVRAQRASGLRLPAIGVTSGTVNSGNNGKVFYLGGVGRTGTFAANSGLLNGISGFQGLPLYVGSGGNIVNLSGMRGVSSGPAFLSGNMQQQIGIAISGGLFVMPSPRITRSGFLGTLPYDI